MKNKEIRNHLSVGLDEFLKRLDCDSRALAFAALVRVFTLGQAARLIWKGSVFAAESVLERLVWKEGKLSKIEEIDLPKGCGYGKTPVYYLTPKGAEALAQTAPSLVRQARPGRPRGANRARIPHELLVAEAYLWLDEQYEIFEFWPETELKRQIGRASVMRENDFDKRLNDEATGDFKALVIARDEGEEERWIHGEIVVRYNERQIKGKPDDALWFAHDPRYVDLVEYIKGRPTVLLGDVRAPLHQGRSGSEGLQKECELEEKIALTRPEQRALQTLDAIGGLVTAEALALVLGAYRTHTSHILKALEAKGQLCGLDAQLVPGGDVGRPLRVYTRAGNQPLSVWGKVKGLICSRMLVEMAAAGYKFSSHNKAKDEMEFTDGTGSGKAPVIVVIDELCHPVERLAERMIDIQSRRQCPLAAVQSAERAARLSMILTGRLEPIRICDVAEARANKPRNTFEECRVATFHTELTISGGLSKVM